MARREAEGPAPPREQAASPRSARRGLRDSQRGLGGAAAPDRAAPPRRPGTASSPRLWERPRAAPPSRTGRARARAHTYASRVIRQPDLAQRLGASSREPAASRLDRGPEAARGSSRRAGRSPTVPARRTGRPSRPSLVLESSRRDDVDRRRRARPHAILAALRSQATGSARPAGPRTRLGCARRGLARLGASPSTVPPPWGSGGRPSPTTGRLPPLPRLIVERMHSSVRGCLPPMQHHKSGHADAPATERNLPDYLFKFVQVFIFPNLSARDGDKHARTHPERRARRQHSGARRPAGRQ